MDDKKLNTPESAQNPVVGELQWVMVFNVTTGVGKDQTKKTYKINKKRILIGSALSSDIRIQQNAVSNVHAVVEMDEAGNASIYDMASETGIFINDKKVPSSELKDGAEIKIGFATLSYKRTPLKEAQAQPQLPSHAVRTSGAQKLFYDAKEDFRPLILEDERDVIQIFDYPNSAEQALQIVMYWGDVILDVRHFVDGEEVTLGEDKKSTFLVPGMHAAFPLVSFDGPEGAVLQFSDEAKGVFRSGKTVTPLSELGKSRITLRKSDQAKIVIKDITFFVSYSPVPPHLRRRRLLERDAFFTRIWFSSLALTVALVVVMLQIEPPKPLEVDELPPRVAAIIFKPVPPPPPPPPVKVKQETPPPEVEKKPPPPPPMPMAMPPKTLPTETKRPPTPSANASKPTEQKAATSNTKGTPRNQAGGDAGEGKRAPGPEGKKGAPNKPKSPVHQVESRGNPNARTAAKSAAANGEGNVETLFKDIEGSISNKLAAGGKGASAAGARLKGYGGFTTEGNGGLGNLGSGSGGGGESQSLSQGLGTKGLGEGASGKGLGAIGSGGNLLGTGHGRPSVQIGGTTEYVILGGLDKGLIDEIIKRHSSQIRYCYEKELNATKQSITGRVLTRFVISGSGRVSQAGVESTSLNNANVESCLLGVLKKIVFPEPAGGGIVEVSYPFNFQKLATE